MRQEVFDKDIRHIMRRRKDQLVFTGGCTRSRSYYSDKKGDVRLIQTGDTARCIGSKLFSENA